MGQSSSKRIHSKHQPGRKEGDKVPNVVIKARIRIAPTEEVSSFVWKDIMIADLFKGKRVVIFSIPGGKSYLFWPNRAHSTIRVLKQKFFLPQLSHLYARAITCRVI